MVNSTVVNYIPKKHGNFVSGIPHGKSLTSWYYHTHNTMVTFTMVNCINHKVLPHPKTLAYHIQKYIEAW